jgi:predicted RNase H-like HicB family nuclease
MKIKIIVHEAILQGRGSANEGGYWAEVPAIPGCATEGDTWDELLSNLYEAIEGCLSIDVDKLSVDDNARILEIAI